MNARCSRGIKPFPLLLHLRPAAALYSDVYSDKDPAASPFTPPSKAMRVWMRESDDRVRSK